MSNVTETNRAAETETERGPTAGEQARSPVVNVTVAGVDPHAPPGDEVEAATYPTLAKAEAVVDDLVAAGVIRDNIVVLEEREEKRNFMKRYVHRDGDRHTHAGTAAVYFALGGALVMGLFGVLIASQLAGGIAWIIGALVGAALGAALGAVLGGMAMRPADDSSIEIVETVAADGILVAVRRPIGSGTVPLEEVGRILARHNGRVLRLYRRANQADLHPGDLRPHQAWKPGVSEPPPDRPR